MSAVPTRADLRLHLEALNQLDHDEKATVIDLIEVRPAAPPSPPTRPHQLMPQARSAAIRSQCQNASVSSSRPR